MQTNVASRPLALAIWPPSESRVVRSIILIVLGTAVLTASAKIVVPYQPVPITLQTFAIMALAAAYGSRLAVATVPGVSRRGLRGHSGVRVGGSGARLLPRTDRRLPCRIHSSGADRRLCRRPRLGPLDHPAVRGDDRGRRGGLRPGLCLAGAVCPAGGHTGIGFAGAWTYGVLPFLLGDLLKIALAALAVPATWGLVGRRG